MPLLKPYLEILATGRPLCRDDARSAFSVIMEGQADHAEMAAFLMALKLRGETVDEIAGGADVLRGKALQLRAPDKAIDTCGTGGAGLSTYNISTAVALVVAASGIPVAKHGNRAVSSKSGSADVLEHLGIATTAPVEQVQTCLDRLGICFLMAPRHHKAMRHVAPVRQSLGIPTIFNVLGPLSNPAGAKRQLIGVYDRRWVEPLAHTLKALGSERVWVVHGADGMDELTITGESHVAALDDGVITTFTVSPEDAGLPCHPLESVQGGDAACNAEALKAVLDGVPSAYRDIVLYNSAAALLVGDHVPTMKEGVAVAAATIDSGKARSLLRNWAALSHGETVYD